MRKSRLRNLAILAAALMVLPGLAAAAEVVLYSSNPSELLDLVSKGFEAKTGIKVSVVRLGTGEAMKRIAAEKDKPLCDVFWSGDVAVLENAKENFQPYRSPEAKGLPAGYVEKEARWTASNAHVMIIMVNKALVKERTCRRPGRTSSLPKWKGKVVMANPEKSGSAYAQAYGIYKLYGWDGIRKLIDNAKILDSSSLIYKGVAAGEYPLGVTMEYAAHRYIDGGDKNVGIIYPADGAFMAPEATGIVKNCPHPAEAKQVRRLSDQQEGGGRDLREILPPAGPTRRGRGGRAALPEQDHAAQELRPHGGQHPGKGDPEEVEGDRPLPLAPCAFELTGITKIFGTLKADRRCQPDHRGGGFLHPPRPQRLRQDDAAPDHRRVLHAPTRARSASATG